MASTVLVVEDELKIREMIRRYLEREELAVITTGSGAEALTIIERGGIELVLLDLNLPDVSGETIAAEIAGAVPILMLTAKDTVGDRVIGLDAGADDYLVKPFAFDELLARIRALLRRAAPTQPEVLRFADLNLDTGTRQAFRAERAIDLTAKEYELLELFMRHPRQVLTREVIFDRVWGYDFGGESNIIEVYVRYLRQKTEAGGESRLVHTVRGVGYVLREE